MLPERLWQFSPGLPAGARGAVGEAWGQWCMVRFLWRNGVHCSLGSAFASTGCCSSSVLESGETYMRYSLLFLDKAGCLLGAYPVSMASPKKNSFLPFDISTHVTCLHVFVTNYARVFTDAAVLSTSRQF